MANAEQLPAIAEAKCTCGKMMFGWDTAAQCPACGQPRVLEQGLCGIHESGLRLPQPRSLVVRPTVGPFSRLTRDTLLHVGVADSSGRVWHFDERGVHAMDAAFGLSLSVPLRDAASTTFDAVLAAHAREWTMHKRYHPIHSNCYDFAVAAMNALQAGGRSDHTKYSVARSFVQPLLARFEGYQAVFRALVQAGCDVIACDALPASSADQQVVCNVCSQPCGAVRWHCQQCDDYDLCDACHSNASAADLAVDGHQPASHTVIRL